MCLTVTLGEGARLGGRREGGEWGGQSDTERAGPTHNAQAARKPRRERQPGRPRVSPLGQHHSMLRASFSTEGLTESASRERDQVTVLLTRTREFAGLERSRVAWGRGST